MQYHISPATGRVNICRADKRACPIGGEHFDSKETAKAASEKALETSHTPLIGLQKSATPRLRASEVENEDGLNPNELVLLKRRLRGQRFAKELKTLKVTSSLPVDVSYNRNGMASFDYNEHETQQLFSKGACGFLAYAIHERTGLPFTVVTEDPKAEYWQGHVAIKLGEDRYLDVTGVSTMDEFVSRYNLNRKKFSFHDVDSPDEYKSTMGIAEDAGVYDKLQDLEKAILDRLARDLTRDFVSDR